MRKHLIPLLFSSLFAVVQPVFAEDAVRSAQEAAALQELKEEKRMIVATNMVLTEEERAPFWKVYDAYQADLDKINGRLVKLLNTYAEELGIFTDEQADGILKDFLAIEEDRVKLKKAYLRKFKRAIPPKKVARYYQIEQKLEAQIKYELAGQVPLAR